MVYRGVKVDKVCRKKCRAMCREIDCAVAHLAGSLARVRHERSRFTANNSVSTSLNCPREFIAYPLGKRAPPHRPVVLPEVGRFVSQEMDIA
jgi:hypothetical protein